MRSEGKVPRVLFSDGSDNQDGCDRKAFTWVQPLSTLIVRSSPPPPLAPNSSRKAGVSPLLFPQVCYLRNNWNVYVCVPRERSRGAGLILYWLIFSEYPFTVVCLCACEGGEGCSMFFCPIYSILLMETSLILLDSLR